MKTQLLFIILALAASSHEKPHEQADNDGNLQFIGEDHIDHTPKDETIKIKMGDAFDLLAERKQTEWKKLAWDLYEVAFEISLRNHKDAPATISVIEPIPGDWEILKTTHDYQKVEAHTVQFDVPVGKGQGGEIAVPGEGKILSGLTYFWD